MWAQNLQIVLDRSQSGLPRCTASALPVLSLCEDPEYRPEELGNGLHWCQHDTGDRRMTGAVPVLLYTNCFMLLIKIDSNSIISSSSCNIVVIIAAAVAAAVASSSSSS